MAFKTIIRVEGETRELLTFSVRYFEAKGWHFETKEGKSIADSIDKLYRAVKSDPHAFIPARGVPYGGLLELTMQSTANDDWLYEWMMPIKTDGIRFEKGVIEFYNDDDDLVPYKCIEFWDAWVVNISETMNSTGNSPMTLRMRISPATVRYDKLLVVQKNWFWTDIDETDSKTAEEREPFVKEICWKGEDVDYLPYRKDIVLNRPIKLQVRLSDYQEGDEIELTVKQSKGRRIKGSSTEFTISGTADENGIAVIEDFEVECGFEKDNQDFDKIEFYHKDRKVAEFIENFGWTLIEDGATKIIYCNVELQIGKMALGCTKEEYIKTIDDQFKKTLELSSGGAVTGKLFFTGKATTDQPQVVPLMQIMHSDSNKNGEGSASGTVATIKTSREDQPDLLMELAVVSIHELMHTLRLDHPFEYTQTEDTRLKALGGFCLESTRTTDPDIFYNIMMYNYIIIDEHRLGDLWRYKLPEYLTKQQMQHILEEVRLQQQGYGCYKYRNARYVDVMDEGVVKSVSEHAAYWQYEKHAERLY